MPPKDLVAVRARPIPPITRLVNTNNMPWHILLHVPMRQPSRSDHLHRTRNLRMDKREMRISRDNSMVLHRSTRNPGEMRLGCLARRLEVTMRASRLGAVVDVWVVVKVLSGHDELVFLIFGEAVFVRDLIAREFGVGFHVAYGVPRELEGGDGASVRLVVLHSIVVHRVGTGDVAGFLMGFEFLDEVLFGGSCELRGEGAAWACAGEEMDLVGTRDVSDVNVGVPTREEVVSDPMGMCM